KVGVQQFRPKRAQHVAKFVVVVHGSFKQPRLCDELVSNAFLGLAERKDAHVHAAASQLRQLPGDERLRQFRKHVDDVSNPPQCHRLTPCIAARCQSTCRASPSSRPTRGSHPRWRRIRVVSAKVWRWSPGRGGACRTRAFRPVIDSMRRRMSLTLAISPPPTLYTSPGGASVAAIVAATQSLTYVLPRTCWPSPNTSIGCSVSKARTKR